MMEQGRRMNIWRITYFGPLDGMEQRNKNKNRSGESTSTAKQTIRRLKIRLNKDFYILNLKEITEKQKLA